MKPNGRSFRMLSVSNFSICCTVVYSANDSHKKEKKKPCRSTALVSFFSPSDSSFFLLHVCRDHLLAEFRFFFFCFRCRTPGSAWSSAFFSLPVSFKSCIAFDKWRLLSKGTEEEKKSTQLQLIRGLLLQHGTREGRYIVSFFSLAPRFAARMSPLVTSVKTAFAFSDILNALYPILFLFVIFHAAEDCLFFSLRFL